MDDVVPILNNMMTWMALNHTRRFVWSDTIFIKMWYDKANTTMRNHMHDAVKRGAFEFVGGTNKISSSTIN